MIIITIMLIIIYRIELDGCAIAVPSTSGAAPRWRGPGIWGGSAITISLTLTMYIYIYIHTYVCVCISLSLSIYIYIHMYI